MICLNKVDNKSGVEDMNILFADAFKPLRNSSSYIWMVAKTSEAQGRRR